MRTVSKVSLFCKRLVVATALCAGLSLMLAGCGLGTLAGAAPEEHATNQLSGKAHGGEQAIQGGSVYLVLTGFSGYGTGDVIAGTATTANDTTGSFTITPTGASCSGGQQAYVVIAGGNTGAGINNQNLLVSAIGSCSTLASTTFTWVNEITTVAAAYALGNFAKTDGTAPYVHIGAPPTNAAAVGTSAAAAGLVHAFMNAANLAICCGTTTGGVANPAPVVSGMVNVTAPVTMMNAVADILQGCVNSTGVNPYLVFPAGSGTPNTSSVTALDAADTISGSFDIIDTPSGSSSGATTTVSISAGTTITNAIAEINAQAAGVVTASPSALNPATGITLTVVNPTDTITFTGTTSNTSNLVDTTAAPTDSSCGTMFSLTPAIDGTRPTNTFQALANMAKNPWVSKANVASLWGRIPPQVVFSPIPTAVPTDFTLGLVMVETSAAFPATTAAAYPYRLALDMNDAVYILQPDSSGATAEDVVSIGNYGGTTWNSNAVSTAIMARGLAADALGGLWIASTSSGTAAGAFYGISALDGSLMSGGAHGIASSTTGNVFSVAVDRNNDVWLTTQQATGNLQELVNTNANPTTAATYATKSILIGNTGTAGTTSTNANGGGGYDIAVDSFQNVWTSDYYGGSKIFGNSVSVLPNVGTVASPCYTSYNASSTPACAAVGGSNSNINTYAVGGTEVLSVAFDGGNFGTAPAAGTYNFNTLAPDVVDEAASGTNTYGVEGLNQVAVTETVNSGGVLSLTVAPFTNIPASGSGATGANYDYTQYIAVDGSGYTWTPNFTGHTSIVTKGNTVLSEPNGFNPCVQTTAIACGTGFGNLRQAAIDASGSLWVSSTGNNGASLSRAGVMQIIGTPTPAWPLLSLGRWGVEP